MKEKKYFKYLDEQGNNRLRLIIRIDKGKILDIVVQFEINVNEQWKAVVR